MARNEPGPKIGAGHASAFFRQGLAELRAALYTDSNVAQPPQYGLYGTRTPGEIAESRRAAELDQEPASQEKDTEPSKDPGDGREPDSPEIDRD